MKNTSFIVMEIVFYAVPSIKSTILMMNNGCKKSGTNVTIISSANNNIKTLPFGIPWFRCFGRIIGNNMINHKISTTMELKNSRPCVIINTFFVKLDGNTIFNIRNQGSQVNFCRSHEKERKGEKIEEERGWKPPIGVVGDKKEMAEGFGKDKKT